MVALYWQNKMGITVTKDRNVGKRARRSRLL